MELMADPTIVLDELRDLLSTGTDLSAYAIEEGYYLFKSDWRPGKERYLFAKIHKLIPLAVSIFCYDPINENPVYNLSYAVSTEYRRKGLAFDISQFGLAVLTRDLKQRGVFNFLLEAVVGHNNIPSIKTSEKIFLCKGELGIESESGAQILYFKKNVTF